MAASGVPGSQAIIAFDIGLGFAAQDQSLGRVDVRPASGLAVNQPVQDVQHVRLGRHALGQSLLHGLQHGLFIVMQDKRQDLDHLPISTRAAQHLLL